jgi:hypothetical protein
VTNFISVTGYFRLSLRAIFHYLKWIVRLYSFGSSLASFLLSLRSYDQIDLDSPVVIIRIYYLPMSESYSDGRMNNRAGVTTTFLRSCKDSLPWAMSLFLFFAGVMVLVR